jgi:diguanylate cyclase (GGDEF)-like protein
MQSLRDLAGLVERELTATAADSAPEIAGRGEQERRRAMLDPLTRTWNRDGILHALNAQLGPARPPATFAVAVLRIDDAQDVAGAFGPEATDELRRAVARRCLGAIRSTDTIGRIDTDEFLLVTGPLSGASQARRIGERLRLRVTAEPVACGRAAVPVSITAGFAMVEPAPGSDATALIERARQSALRAQAAGGNAVRLDGEQSPDDRAAA